MARDKPFRNQMPGGDRWTGSESAWVGSNPPAGMRKIRKEFTAVATTDVSGLATITYPGGAFPNGILSVVISPGDTAGGLGYFQVNVGLQSLSQLKAYAWTANTNVVITSTLIRANVIAVGW